MRLLNHLTTLRSDYSHQRITRVLLIAWLLASCSPLGAVQSGGATPTPAPPTQLPTETHTPAPTATAIPSPTPEPWTLAPYPAELAEEELTVQIATDGAVQALDDNGRVAAAWDGSTWVRVLPPLPVWAEGYAKHHQGTPEQIGDKWYYTVDRTVEVNGETRAVQVKLLELTEKGEWLPCYETIEELLKTKQLMTLMKLNQISAPEEALWLVRTGETIETEREDLVKLEQIMARFMEDNDHLFEGDGWGAISAFQRNESFPRGVMTVERLFRLTNEPQYLMDGVDISYPHALFTLQRGTTDQVLLGGVPLRFDHTTLWLGYDQSVLETAVADWGSSSNKMTVKLGEVVLHFQNLENHKVMGASIFHDPRMIRVPEVSEYFELAGGDPEYVLRLMTAYRGYFVEYGDYLSGGKIFWLHSVQKR